MTQTGEYQEEATELLSNEISAARANGNDAEDVLQGRTKLEAITEIAKELAYQNSDEGKAEAEAIRQRKAVEREERRNALVQCTECGSNHLRKDIYEIGQEIFCKPCAGI